jgi:hypothetical protein
LSSARALVIVRHVAATDFATDARAVEQIAEALDTALARAELAPDDLAAIGVGVPGRVEPRTCVVTLAVNLGWYDLPLGPLLAARDRRFRAGRPAPRQGPRAAQAISAVAGHSEDRYAPHMGTARHQLAERGKCGSSAPSSSFSARHSAGSERAPRRRAGRRRVRVSSDFRATAAGVTMTVVPILVFFIAVQRVFVRGLTGAVKG